VASHFARLFVKELKVTFRDPTVLIGTILVPVILLPLMGGAIRAGTEAVEEQVQAFQVAYFSMDGQDGNDTYARVFLGALSAANTTVVNATGTAPDEALAFAVSNRMRTLVVLPKNFTERIAAGHSAVVEYYAVLSNFGPAELAGAQHVENAVAYFDRLVAADRIAATLPNSTPEEALFPALSNGRSVINGQIRNVRPDVVVNAVALSAVSLPIVLGIMITLAAQLAAVSVATEKEEKTLEVLLTLPTRRENILLGKLAGVFVVSLVGTGSLIVGFSYYMGSFTGGAGGAPIDPATTGLNAEPAGYALLLVTLLLAFLSALSLAVLLATYAKDIYGAQSLLGIVVLPVFLPFILLAFAPIDILPLGLQIAIYALPFSYPTLAARALFTHDYAPIVLGVIYQLVFTAGVLFLAARMFTTEKVLTARLSLGKRKQPPEE
jgi:ABC-2 type transport system permease protein